ncbi:MAG: MFS transporter [Chloroflexi bacterium]|nr:MFS transporter [Chloroflexota bacterium]
MLAAAATSTLLGTSDFSIVAIALPAFTEVFSASTSTVVWIALSYQLVVLGLALPMGRLGDQFGNKTVFATGALIYTVGLTSAAAAPNILTLIAFRAVQGAGAAMMVSLSLGLVSNAFPANERGKALGLIASVAGFGLMSGPALGGLLLDTLGWRSIFWMRAPFAFAGFVLAMVYLRNMRATADKRTDFIGAALLFAALVLMAVGLNRGSAEGWTSPLVVLALPLSGAVLTAFALRSVRIESPVVDIRMFRNPALSLSSALMLMAGVSMMAITFTMPFYLLIARGLSPAAAGLVMLAHPAAILVLPPLTGRLSDRIGPRVPTSLGLGLSASALFLLATLLPHTSVLLIVCILALGGIGGAFFQAPNQSVIMSAAPRDRVGTVSALVPTLRYIGLITGVAASEAVFTSGLGATGLSGAGAGTITAAAQTVFLVFGGVASVGALTALFRDGGRASGGGSAQPAP